MYFFKKNHLVQYLIGPYLTTPLKEQGLKNYNFSTGVNYILIFFETSFRDI